MVKYLVNSTYCIYLLDVAVPYFDENVLTINDVVEEVKNERGIKIEAITTSARKASIVTKSQRLSSTDISILETAKAGNYVIISDDKKVIATARNNKIKVINTPHFMHRLLLEEKLSKEKIKEILTSLKTKYNRPYVIDKVLKDIEKWGG